MNTFKLILTLLAMIALVLVPAVASADTFTFDVTDGDWQTQGNWTPVGRPGSADNAIIPNGKTCRVKTANQAADDVDVQSGGTLVIESKNLTISSGTTLTVNGTGRLEINNTGGGAGQLLWLSGNLTIDGSGTIDAGDGVITNSGSTTGDLSIGTSGTAGPDRQRRTHHRPGWQPAQLWNTLGRRQQRHDGARETEFGRHAAHSARQRRYRGDCRPHADRAHGHGLHRPARSALDREDHG